MRKIIYKGKEVESEVGENGLRRRLEIVGINKYTLSEKYQEKPTLTLGEVVRAFLDSAGVEDSLDEVIDSYATHEELDAEATKVLAIIFPNPTPAAKKKAAKK